MFDNKVQNALTKVGGSQVIHTDHRWMPCSNQHDSGLPHIRMEPNAAEEFDALPRVIITQGGEWNPTVLADHALADDADWASKAKQEDDQQCDSPFNKRGEHKHEKPPKAGVTINDPAGPPNEDPDDIEINFHAVHTAIQVHQAHDDM